MAPKPLNLPIPMPDFDPNKPAGRHHPAFGYTLVTLILLGGVVVFGFITVFIPWAMKDLAPGQRAWAYPFKTCIENTFSDVNEETCIDNDFIEPGGVPVTGRTKECMGFILATIAFVFISVLLGLLTVILLIWILVKLWTRPLKSMLVAVICTFIVWWAAMLAWIMFICYAENECVPDSIFPVKGYSYGFIMYVFASAMGLAAFITSVLAWWTLKSYKPVPASQFFQEYAAPADQGYPAFTSSSPYGGQFMTSDQALNTTPAFTSFM